MRALLLSLLFATAAVAGCIDTDPSDNLDLGDAASDAFRPPVTTERLPVPDFDFEGVIDEDHGGAAYLHAVPELHEGSHGLDLVGYNPLTELTSGDGPGSDSAYIAMDTFGDLVCIAHFAGSTGVQGGATIVDISDPTDPVVLSSVMSAAVNSDCQFTDDGQYLVLATYLDPTGSYLEPPSAPVGEAAVGVAVYDVSDPAAPEYLFSSSEGAGADGYHNVFTAKINGTNYIFQTYTGNILKIKEDGSGLEMVSQIDHSDHDLWVGHHPITGEWVVVTGAGYGTAVFNIDDPEDPVLLGVWEGDRENRYAGWHRQWPVENTIDGRAYMVVGGEECGNGDSLPYQVLDWTDPANMEMTGSWWIPGKPANLGAGGLIGQPTPDHLCEMNSHEFEVWDGYVASGNYHAGIWLFDVGSPERVQEPVTLGYYLPSEVPQANGGTANAPFVWSPNVWGAYFDERGYIVAADWYSGLYILSFGATAGETADDTE